jgi:hypothetical protein
MSSQKPSEDFISDLNSSQLEDEIVIDSNSEALNTGSRKVIQIKVPEENKRDSNSQSMKLIDTMVNF